MICMPLSYVFSSFFLNLDLMNTLLIMLKQGVNMLFNVLIANILIILIEAILQSKTKRKVSLQEILFNLMMLFFLFPLLGSLIYVGQGDLNDVKKDIQKQIDDTKNSSVFQLNSLYSQHISPLVGVADRIKYTDGKALVNVKNDLIFIQHAFPSFKVLYVSDKYNQIQAVRFRNIFRDFKPHSGVSHSFIRESRLLIFIYQMLLILNILFHCRYQSKRIRRFMDMLLE